MAQHGFADRPANGILRMARAVYGNNDSPHFSSQIPAPILLNNFVHPRQPEHGAKGPDDFPCAWTQNGVDWEP
jgi:hypothetical protein